MKITKKQVYSGKVNLPKEAKQTRQGIKNLEEQIQIELTTDEEKCKFMDALCEAKNNFTPFETAKSMLEDLLAEAERIHKKTGGTIKTKKGIFNAGIPITSLKKALKIMNGDKIMTPDQTRELTEKERLGSAVINVINGIKDFYNIFVVEAYEHYLKPTLERGAECDRRNKDMRIEKQKISEIVMEKFNSLTDKYITTKCKKVAKKLNEEGKTTVKGEKFTEDNIRKIYYENTPKKPKN